MDKTARKGAEGHKQLNKKRLLFSSLAVGGLPTGQNGPAKNPTDSAKAKEAGSEAGIQLDRAALGKAGRRRQLEKWRLVSQLDRLCTVQKWRKLPGLGQLIRSQPEAYSGLTAIGYAKYYKSLLGMETWQNIDTRWVRFSHLSAQSVKKQ